MRESAKESERGEVSKMEKLPKCCGREMKLNIETVKFFEAQCGSCGDVVYLKKDRAEKPQMLDD